MPPIPPSAMRHLLQVPSSVDTDFVLTVVLAAVYGFICLLSCFFIVRVIYYRHKMLSFQGGFFVICFVWTLLRVVFFSNPRAQWPAVPTTLLFWIPMNLQFAMFSLLVVFYARVVLSSAWDGYYRKRVMTVYVVLNIFVVIMTFVWVGLTIHYVGNEALTNGHAWFNASLFALLTVSLMVFGLMLSRMVGQSTTPVLIPFITQPQASKPYIVTVTLVIIVVFSSRCVYNVLSAVDIIAVYFNDRMVNPEIFCCQMLWEIIPTLAVLLFFRRVPKTRLGLFSSRHVTDLHSRRLPAQLYLNEESARSSTIINNPARYDTDDESIVPSSAKTGYGKSPWSVWGSSPSVDSPIHHDPRQYGSIQQPTTPSHNAHHYHSSHGRVQDLKHGSYTTL